LPAANLDLHQFAHPDRREHQQFQHKFVLHFAVVPHRFKEPGQCLRGQQLGLFAFPPGLLELQFIPCLLANMNQVVVAEVVARRIRLARRATTSDFVIVSDMTRSCPL